MRMIFKNVDLLFLSKKKKYFKDIISGVNEFGGGYYPVTAIRCFNNAVGCT